MPNLLAEITPYSLVIQDSFLAEEKCFVMQEVFKHIAKISCNKAKITKTEISLFYFDRFVFNTILNQPTNHFSWKFPSVLDPYFNRVWESVYDILHLLALSNTILLGSSFLTNFFDPIIKTSKNRRFLMPHTFILIQIRCHPNILNLTSIFAV